VLLCVRREPYVRYLLCLLYCLYRVVLLVHLLLSVIYYYSVGIRITSISGSSPVGKLGAVLYVVPSFSLGRPWQWDSPTLLAVGVVGLLGMLGVGFGVSEVCEVMFLSGPVFCFILGGC
jgi:hypothetical protein